VDRRILTFIWASVKALDFRNYFDGVVATNLAQQVVYNRTGTTTT
jgi:hypothetical protein